MSPWDAHPVAEPVGRAIATGRLAPGHVIRVEDLEAHYRVSRAVVREGLRILEALGLVALRPGVGSTVRERSDWLTYDPRVIAWRLSGPRLPSELDQLLQLRVAVEPMAARLACVNPDAAQTLTHLGERMGELASRSKGGSAEFLSTDLEFHTTLLSAGGNDYFIGLIAPIMTLLKERAQRGLQPARPDPAFLVAHVDIARAVRGNQPDEAERVTRELMHAVAAEVLLGSARQVHREPTIAEWAQMPSDTA